MNEKKLFQQKKQAQLDEWKAEVSKLKAKVSMASADTQQDLNKQIKTLEDKIEEGKTRLAEIRVASEDSWDSIKESVESTWDSLKSAFSSTAAKFKR